MESNTLMRELCAARSAYHPRDMSIDDSDDDVTYSPVAASAAAAAGMPPPASSLQLSKTARVAAAAPKPRKARQARKQPKTASHPLHAWPTAQAPWPKVRFALLVYAPGGCNPVIMAVEVTWGDGDGMPRVALTDAAVRAAYGASLAMDGDGRIDEGSAREVHISIGGDEDARTANMELGLTPLAFFSVLTASEELAVATSAAAIYDASYHVHLRAAYRGLNCGFEHIPLWFVASPSVLTTLGIADPVPNVVVHWGDEHDTPPISTAACIECYNRVDLDFCARAEQLFGDERHCVACPAGVTSIEGAKAAYVSMIAAKRHDKRVAAAAAPAVTTAPLNVVATSSLAVQPPAVQPPAVQPPAVQPPPVVLPPRLVSSAGTGAAARSNIVRAVVLAKAGAGGSAGDAAPVSASPSSPPSSDASASASARNLGALEDGNDVRSLASKYAAAYEATRGKGPAFASTYTASAAALVADRVRRFKEIEGSVRGVAQAASSATASLVLVSSPPSPPSVAAARREDEGSSLRDGLIALRKHAVRLGIALPDRVRADLSVAAATVEASVTAGVSEAGKAAAQAAFARGVTACVELVEAARGVRAPRHGGGQGALRNIKKLLKWLAVVGVNEKNEVSAANLLAVGTKRPREWMYGRKHDGSA